MSERPAPTVPESKKRNCNLNSGGANGSRGQRIPENLWGIALELAKQYGLWPTARALHLDHNSASSRRGDNIT